ncbi:Coenzyme Q-binding protein COQ10 homolog mitochondrial [Babesia microti strain RI]|uniref:Coenzyme Q-binding protein COQ10 homolog mitochondrial n=1 Tax=Babesia microti (strain RI) TaxID=1133968 RepID=I7IP39_BABMR|nr:Coenzyme Q-binding protein COQ10 homolog mitochondrial [Babesia microti strain RI]CCF72670.1 Coenzyme Q-binding protein COQ10 homolog mitochondrial [Babesia microti strain RI]|eukprot:XP_012647279.1 Coenzyme Q-binding protein COQ10 homolog mitochondrial [Babesia microti strain RI]
MYSMHCYNIQYYHNLHDVARLAKVERYSSFLPWCKESRWIDSSHEVKIRPYPVSSNAILGVKFGIFNEKYISTVTYHYPLYIKAVASDDSLFKHLETTWNFSEGASSGLTLLEFKISFEFKDFLHQKCAKLFINKISRTMVNSFISETKRGINCYRKIKTT